LIEGGVSRRVSSPLNQKERERPRAVPG